MAWTGLDSCPKRVAKCEGGGRVSHWYSRKFCLREGGTKCAMRQDLRGSPAGGVPGGQAWPCDVPVCVERPREDGRRLPRGREAWDGASAGGWDPTGSWRCAYHDQPPQKTLPPQTARPHATTVAHPRSPVYPATQSAVIFANLGPRGYSSRFPPPPSGHSIA